MTNYAKILLTLVALGAPMLSSAQNIAQPASADSAQSANLKSSNQIILSLQQKYLRDSIKRAELEAEINSYKSSNSKERIILSKQIEELINNQKNLTADKKAKLDSLKKTNTGYPAIGPLRDTLFKIYAYSGAFTPKERATNISLKVKKLYKDVSFNPELLQVMPTENSSNIVYGENIIMSVNSNDALWNDDTEKRLATQYRQTIITSIEKAREQNRFGKVALRVGFILLIISLSVLLIWLIGIGSKRIIAIIDKRKGRWLKDLKYKDYTLLSDKQELVTVFFIIKIVKWLLYIIILYISIPIAFSIFPFTQGWASFLFNLILKPLNKVLIGVWSYIPNLFSIIVIVFVMRYVIRFVKYLFTEIEEDRLKISGFHPDWAKPTASIVTFLLYAFMFVVIYPFLPGSDSGIFKGVSVFIGVLFSLGSSSAIANIIAGLVITYMRPFKIGDRIKIGEVSGDVIEKTLLVTRIKTVKNEEITMPNSSILTGNTINYSSFAKSKGLIVHSTVTIGYDVPWRAMHQALIDAALKTDLVMKEPSPFVLQTSLDDFYVSYQINAYTHESSKMALVYSTLHQNIQDVCAQRGIEIMSPHYRSNRDGNTSTIPEVDESEGTPK